MNRWPKYTPTQARENDERRRMRREKALSIVQRYGVVPSRWRLFMVTEQDIREARAELTVRVRPQHKRRDRRGPPRGRARR